MYVMMVGVPGSGKSTVIKQLIAELTEPVFIASTDDLLEAEASCLGLTYSEAFHKVNQKMLKSKMEDGVNLAVLKRQTIIHDQTNMSRKSRAGKLKDVPACYFKVCMNFTVDDRVLQERLDARAAATGKVIPPFVLKNMFNSYNPPTQEEGFELIIEVDNT